MSSGKIAETLDRFFTEAAPLEAGSTLVVAFSGGPDSTALLWGLSRLRDRQVDLVAAHLDHGLDQASARRAAQAAELATQLDVPFVGERALGAERFMERGVEDWARDVRYTFLERQRERLGAPYIAMGHHSDDQVETILLRLLMGSGLEGLGGMPAMRGHLVRPLLTRSRSDLEAALASAGLDPVLDTSNLDLDRPRNLVRHRLLPHLRMLEPEIDQLILQLGDASRRVTRATVERLTKRLEPRSRPDGPGASIALDALRSLRAPLWPFALSMLNRTAGLPYPPAASAQRELRQQLERRSAVGCDCGDSWHWMVRAGRLELAPRETPQGRFTYTLEVPGELEIPELGVRLSVQREDLAPWMLEGRPTRAALDLPLVSGDRVVVRNRWPGDRIRPLGCSYSRRLKEVLIDRRVPRFERDRLPLVCVGDRIAWVPGVTVHDAFRLSPDSRPWVARLEPV